MKRGFIIAGGVIGVLVILGAAFYMFGGVEKVRAMFQPKNQTQSVTMSGKILCLPAKDTSQTSTLSCAMGLQTSDGKYYGLSGAQNTDLAAAEGSDKTFTIKGTLEPKNDATYAMEGILAISSFTAAN